MFRNGLIKSGCLVKCTKDVGYDKAHRIFVKGRPYRVIVTAKVVMALKSEGGYPVFVQVPIPFKRSPISHSWTNFIPITS
jgi:hypothetical protein